MTHDLPAAPPPPFRLAYNVKEASKLLPLNEESVRRLVRSGELRSFKVGRIHVIAHAEIERWLKERTKRAALELDAMHAKYERV